MICSKGFFEIQEELENIDGWYTYELCCEEIAQFSPSSTRYILD